MKHSARAPGRQDLPTFDEWIGALPDLKVEGRRKAKGPCPVCGGEDRFHVELKNGRACVGCRTCIDGLPAPERGKAFGAILKAAFPDRHPDKTARAARPIKKPARAKAKPKRNDTGAAAFKAAEAADGTPARRYLAARAVWPPDGTGEALPPTIRWCDRDAWPAAADRLPDGAAGAILFLLTDPNGKGRAVQAHALHDDSRRVEPRWFRTLGSSTGLAFTPTPGIAADDVVLVEGPVDALAMLWRYPTAHVIASLGAQTLPAMLPHVRRVGPGAVVIEGDGNAPGRKGGEAARRKLVEAGYKVDHSPRADGDGDPADSWAAAFDGDWSAVFKRAFYAAERQAQESVDAAEAMDEYTTRAAWIDAEIEDLRAEETADRAAVKAERARNLTAEEVVRQAGYDLPDDDEIDAIFKEDAAAEVKASPTKKIDIARADALARAEADTEPPQHVIDRAVEAEHGLDAGALHRDRLDRPGWEPPGGWKTDEAISRADAVKKDIRAKATPRAVNTARFLSWVHGRTRAARIAENVNGLPKGTLR